MENLEEEKYLEEQFDNTVEDIYRYEEEMKDLLTKQTGLQGEAEKYQKEADKHREEAEKNQKEADERLKQVYSINQKIQQIGSKIINLKKLGEGFLDRVGLGERGKTVLTTDPVPTPPAEEPKPAPDFPAEELPKKGGLTYGINNDGIVLTGGSDLQRNSEGKAGESESSWQISGDTSFPNNDKQ